jgi:hypothetical protein
MPVLAVVRYIDAQVPLAGDDVDHRSFEQVQEFRGDSVGFLGLVGGQQLRRAGQRTGVGDADVVSV